MGKYITCLRDKINSEFDCSLRSSVKFASRMHVGLWNSISQCVYLRPDIPNESNIIYEMGIMLCEHTVLLKKPNYPKKHFFKWIP